AHRPQGLRKKPRNHVVPYAYRSGAIALLVLETVTVAQSNRDEVLRAVARRAGVGREAYQWPPDQRKAATRAACSEMTRALSIPTTARDYKCKREAVECLRSLSADHVQFGIKRTLSPPSRFRSHRIRPWQRRSKDDDVP